MGEIVLGMPGPWAKDYREESDHYTTKIGGFPDWPIRDMSIGPDVLNCGLCGEELCLVAQVYAPISTPKVNIEERVIYILGCRVPKCGSDPHSWRAIRVQRCHDEMHSATINKVPITLEGDSTPVSKSNNCYEDGILCFGEQDNDSDDDVDLEELRRAFSEAGKEPITLEEDSTPISKSNNFYEDGILCFGEQDNDSDDDVDLEELRRACSETGAQASQSRKQNVSAPPKYANVLVPKPRSINDDSNKPVIPCFYIFTQKAQSPSSLRTVCSSYSRLFLKGIEISPNDHDPEERWEGENYEYDRALGADRTYLKFKKQLDLHPEQCFRYSYGGNPLLATTGLVEPGTCRICSPRQYEMQLMSPLLYFLHQAADEPSTCIPEEWSWMTLILFSCSSSCCPQSRKQNSSSCSWTVAEETIVVQDE